MRDRSYLLDGLRCSECLNDNTLWLDLAAGLVECRGCGQGALIDPDHEGDAW
ncbi:hypothetical protein ACIHFD_43515 [Nonomuraea sp. NPDC051941]|uniref:hypothetical protein n=1 Tax=Nonomuraea sp. NPDC051941 TaxID=3364373 RepID=UPI0037CAADC8